ncbi:NAD(P)-dependent oxidoreductase [Streptomyces acidiscabies]|uniref:NAD(P)-dependent oxidoreductase n=1 Tax=Streptomyces acidiscabies TaxID=42234 RepID=UPI00095202E7|nr:NAD(P)H-binding protein [Streptomyces acidiscabies]
MKLTILGASGRTGTRLAEQALAAGHDVEALIRNPAKLTLRHERLRIAQGDLTDEVAVEEAVRGADAVLAALSPKIFGGPRDLPLASGTGTILAAMRTQRPQACLQLRAEHLDSPQPAAARVAQRELRSAQAAARHPPHGQRVG